MKDFIKKIPKAELHLHIEGTLEPELMFKLANRNHVKIPYKSVEEVKKAYEFTNLQTFLDIYFQAASVLITEQDFYDLTWAYFTKIKEQNVVHAEVFFDPQTHTDRGISFETVITGINKAIMDARIILGISSKLIMCFLRHLSAESAMQTLRQSLPDQEKIIAVGLDSSEVGNPPEKFANVFAEAQRRGYMTVAHAGEEGPPEYIWGALNELNVRRIDHGVRCLEDDKLVAELLKRNTPLTLCPLSNVKLRVFDTMKDHNIKKLMDKGLLVTINSDDPAYFGGYVNENYEAIQEAFDFTKEDIALLAKNSFQASFLTEDEKKKHIKNVDQFLIQNS